MAAEPSYNGHESEQQLSDAVRAQLHQLRHEPGTLLERLESFVSYEIGRRIAMGQLGVTDVQRDEVVDHAFASALTRLQEGVPIRDLHTYLRSRAQDTIRREVRRVANERVRLVSLDQIVYNEGDDGEQVTLADIIPDTESRTLEDASIDAETFGYLMESLAGLPDRWRTIFLQRTIHGQNVFAIAEEHEIPVDEVRRIVVRSRDYLRDQMENVHFALDEDDF
ncbi:MAG TPA: sigma-70 family RNA polymerase sigma factor [Thermomicrobiales bacterium]|nr:sigma-70 family RNA polymerase sigma factor [Thermomicrobiales bacterium]